VRFDRAIYGSYNRHRRDFSEHIFAVPATFAPSHHASTIVELPDGDILCAWFGGTSEGAKDVGIWLSRRHRECWTAPIQIVAPQGEPCWNPVLFLADRRRLDVDIYHNGDISPFVDESIEPTIRLYYRTGTGARDGI